VSVDEAHRLPMDRFYRLEFIALKETLFDKIQLSLLKDLTKFIRTCNIQINIINE
jgi:hypothetical protein